MAKRDYYEVLGAKRDASPEELKKAYRTLAMKHHPDRNAGEKKSEEKLKEINEAYEILKDSQKKAAYDRMGHAAFDQSQGFGGGRSSHSAGGGFSSSGNGGFSSIFEEMFGDFMDGGQRSGGQPQSQRGNDLRADVTLTLEEAFKGIQKEINLRTYAKCTPCTGTGSNDGSKTTTCATCHGRGVVRAQQGFFTIERACTTCQGRGTVIKDACKTCHGQGRVNKSRTVKVSIPAGVEEGSRIRLSGEGEAGPNNGPSGDMYVFIALAKHKQYTRHNSDLHYEATVAMTIAALGGDIDVPTIEGGHARVSIPAGTQSGKQFRLKGKGMSILRRQDRGDFYVHVHVETPTHLTARQKELLTEFNQIATGKSKSASQTKPKAGDKSLREMLGDIIQAVKNFFGSLFVVQRLS